MSPRFVPLATLRHRGNVQTLRAYDTILRREVIVKAITLANRDALAALAERRAETAFALAQAVWPIDRARARHLAEHALRAYTQAGPKWRRYEHAVRAWLRVHGEGHGLASTAQLSQPEQDR